ncbi:MAG TPA: hypothetical protein VIL84_05860 [Devosiaceae bacterium]
MPKPNFQSRIAASVFAAAGLVVIAANGAAMAQDFKDTLTKDQRFQACSSVPVDTVVTIQLTNADGTTTTGKVHCEAEDQISPSAGGTNSAIDAGIQTSDDEMDDGNDGSDDNSLSGGSDDSSDHDSGDDNGGSSDGGGEDD